MLKDGSQADSNHSKMWLTDYLAFLDAIIQLGERAAIDCAIDAGG